MSTLKKHLDKILQASSMQKPKVALDTNCMRYYIGNPPVQPWADCLDPIFRAALEGKIELCVSTVVVSELLSQLHFAYRNTGYNPDLDLLAIINRHFRVLDVSVDVAKAAGRLRGNYVPSGKIVLKTPDALIGATSLANKHTLFITNDAQLAKALPPENCIYLREYVTDWLAQQFPVQCLATGNLLTPAHRSLGQSWSFSLEDIELGSVRPNPFTTLGCILADAFTVANVLNEPCVFFVLIQKNGRREEPIEILFWHEGLNEKRPPKRIVKRLREHLGISINTDNQDNVVQSQNSIYVFCFTSLNRERARQSQPHYASKSEFEREIDAWKCYLKPLWHFRSVLSLSQTTWMLCEDGQAQILKPDKLQHFLNQAKNVFGWEEGRDEKARSRTS